MSADVTVCIPSIPRRTAMLQEAVRSVQTQTGVGDPIIAVNLDTEGVGAARSRNAALESAKTKWVAFLDDDDLLYPQHLDVLTSYAEYQDADLVYPWFDLHEGVDPLAVRIGDRYVSPFGLPFGPEHETHLRTEGNFIPVTVLVRRELLMDVGGFPLPYSEDWPHPTNEDWGCWRRLLDAGAKFAHAPERTWRWRWHHGNTSGRPWK